jgi:anti-anti-sigma factor
MRAHHHDAPLVVVRSEAASGRVGLRLIGELDLNTVELLDAELAHTREHSPPSVIDLSELRFLDLAGLRALQRACPSDAAATTRLVGATGIVRRLIELARVLDAESAGALGLPFPCEPTTRVSAEHRDGVIDEVARVAATNGSRSGLRVASASIIANGNAL